MTCTMAAQEKLKYVYGKKEPGSGLEVDRQGRIVYGVKNNAVPVNVTAPTFIRPGEIILIDGQLYTGLDTTTYDVPYGDPWPVKGYKEWVGKIENLDSSGINVTVYSNTLNDTIDWVYDSIPKAYTTVNFEIANGWISVGNPFLDGDYIVTANIDTSTHPIVFYFDISNPLLRVVPPTGAEQATNVELRKYPPKK